MLNAAILFFLLAITSFIFGFYGVAGLSMEIGRILVVGFIILAILSAIVHIFRGKK
jgi:uncharacterized membrane protein YtjA (UPF0391 family)